MTTQSVAIDTPLVLSPFAKFRSSSAADLIEAHVGRRVYRLEPLQHDLAMEFRSPRTIAELYSSLETDADVSDVREAVAGLVELGVVALHDDEDLPLETILHPKTFADPSLLARVGAAIAAGHAVAIPNAFDEALAERAYEGLSATRNWLPHERFDLPFFHFRHHNIYDEADLPSEVRPFRRVIGSQKTRATMSHITGSDCDGDPTIGASLYLPGDYSLPHTDGAEGRSIAYVWYLTKDWQPEWGGHFVWCPTGAIANPAFNTLLVFRVDDTSLHFVAPVAPTARGRRMAVNGWWRTKDPRPREGRTGGDWPFPLLAGEYGGGTRRLDATSNLVLL